MQYNLTIKVFLEKMALVFEVKQCIYSCKIPKGNLYTSYSLKELGVASCVRHDGKNGSSIGDA
jgi:hypothetical protein